MRYACKLRQFPEHPTYDYVFSRRIIAVFQGGRSVRAVPLCVRVRSVFQEANIRLRGVATVTTSRIPPWEIAVPSPDISLAEFKKSEMSVVEARSRALERISLYCDHTQYFTDGSKTEGGVGCSFVNGPVTRSFTLPSHATVFTSELVAIHKALCFIEVSDDYLNVIFTDSLSSLLALSDFNTSHPIIQNILTLLTSLHRAEKSVEFCWIPSHVGISGNEQADEAAKRAARSQCTRSLPLPANDFLSVCSSYIRKKWQEDWDNIVACKLKTIKPRLSPWASSLRKSRIEEVILSRLRIGHTLATHRFLLCGDDRPRCSRCGEDLTVAHVLISCRHLNQKRASLFGSTSPSLKELLDDCSDHIPQVFRFLSDIDFPVIF